jgi:hypothetical protein
VKRHQADVGAVVETVELDPGVGQVVREEGTDEVGFVCPMGEEEIPPPLCHDFHLECSFCPETIVVRRVDVRCVGACDRRTFLPSVTLAV